MNKEDVLHGVFDKNGEQVYVGCIFKIPVEFNQEYHGDFSYYELIPNRAFPLLGYIRSDKKTGIPKHYMVKFLQDYIEDIEQYCFTGKTKLSIELIN